MVRLILFLMMALCTINTYSQELKGIINRPGTSSETYAWIDNFHYLLKSSVTLVYYNSEDPELYSRMLSKYDRSAILCAKSIGQSIVSYDIEGKVSVPAEIRYENYTYWVQQLYMTFMGCSKITEVELPETITDIHAAFYNCTSLQSIKIPQCVNVLYGGTFLNCRNLKTVELSPYIERFQGTEGVFEGCDNIETIVCPIENPPTCRESDFTSKCYKNATLYVPEKSIVKYKNDEVWKNFINIKSLSDYSGVYEIVSDSSLNNDEKIEIYNMNGQKVFNGLKINAKLSPGVYIVREGNTTRKIIVN